MKKVIIPIIGFLAVIVIYLISTDNENKVNEECTLKLDNLNDRFCDATGIFNDDEEELKKIRTEAFKLSKSCERVGYKKAFLELKSKCNKELN